MRDHNIDSNPEKATPYRVKIGTIRGQLWECMSERRGRKERLTVSRVVRQGSIWSGLFVEGGGHRTFVVVVDNREYSSCSMLRMSANARRSAGDGKRRKEGRVSYSSCK
jgi:hypothetical protein